MASENASPRGRLNGGAMISTSPNERALLSCLLAKLAALDADVLVGHNIGAYELAVLMGRLQTHKVQGGAQDMRRRTFAWPVVQAAGTGMLVLVDGCQKQCAGCPMGFGTPTVLIGISPRAPQKTVLYSSSNYAWCICCLPCWLQVQLWSRLGRLKRSNFPKMTGGGHTFGGGAAPGLMSVLAGRLLCDTYLSGVLQQPAGSSSLMVCEDGCCACVECTQVLVCMQMHGCRYGGPCLCHVMSCAGALQRVHTQQCSWELLLGGVRYSKLAAATGC